MKGVIKFQFTFYKKNIFHQSYDSCNGGNINCQKESCLLKCYFEKAKWCLIEKFGMKLKSVDGS